MNKTILLALALALFAPSLHAAPTITHVDPGSGFTYGPTRVTIHGTDFVDSNCPPGGPVFVPCPIRVFFGDVEGIVVEATPTAIRATVLQHPLGRVREPGSVDVRVVAQGKGESTLANGFRFDTFPEPSSENFTPVLVPIAGGVDIPGANGSLWRSEFTAFNSSGIPLSMIGPFNNPILLAPALDYTVPPRGTLSIPIFRSAGNATEGAFVYVPNPLLEGAHLSLRVRDVSKTARNWGTEIPIVRGEDFNTNIILPDIPTDSRFRATLRIYHFSPAAGLPTRVSIYDPAKAEPIAQVETISRAASFSFDPLVAHPAYAQVDFLTPEIRAAASTIRIEVDNLSAIVSPPLPNIWAFVSITNNETQEVTIVTPK